MCLDTRFTKMSVAVIALFGARTAHSAHYERRIGGLARALDHSTTASTGTVGTGATAPSTGGTGMSSRFRGAAARSPTGSGETLSNSSFEEDVDDVYKEQYQNSQYWKVVKFNSTGRFACYEYDDGSKNFTTTTPPRFPGQKWRDVDTLPKPSGSMIHKIPKKERSSATGSMSAVQKCKTPTQTKSKGLPHCEELKAYFGGPEYVYDRSSKKECVQPENIEDGTVKVDQRVGLLIKKKLNSRFVIYDKKGKARDMLFAGWTQNEDYGLTYYKWKLVDTIEGTVNWYYTLDGATKIQMDEPFTFYDENREEVAYGYNSNVNKDNFKAMRLFFKNYERNGDHKVKC